MSFGTIVGAVLQVAVMGALGWIVADLALKRWVPDADFGLPERCLLAIAGAVAFAVMLVVGNIVTGGAVFGLAPVVPIVGLAVLAYGFRRATPPRGIRWAPLAAAALVLGALYLAPVVVSGSGVRTGDPPWHLGWTQEMLAGEPIPTGPAPEFGRNSYPWGLHGLLATMVRLVPGTDALVAYEALQLLLVIALPLGAACMARALDRRAGWAGAAAMTLIGGFGWLVAERPDFVASPSRARYGADLVVASPNAVYEMFPSGAPRELGLVLLAAAGVLLIASAGWSERRSRYLVGAAVGLVGLMSVPMFVSALLWTGVIVAFMPRGKRLHGALQILGAAGLVFALWAGPVLANYVRHGGFVSITPRLGKEWPLVIALASWGLLLVGTIAGLALAWRSPGRPARIFLGITAATAVLLAFAKARGTFEWDLAGNATLLHQGRVWPVAHLLGAALTGLALIKLYLWLRARSRALGAVAVAGSLAIGAASPALASVRLTEIMSDGAAGFTYASSDLDGDGFVRRAAAHLDPDDVVAVMGDEPRSSTVGFLLWQFSGVKLADFVNPQLQGNELRIRYRDLAARWSERMHDGGFAPDLVARPLSGNTPVIHSIEVARGEYGGEMWGLYRAP